MSEVSTVEPKGKQESGFIALLKGMGCFFISLGFFLLIFALVGFYLFAPVVTAIRIQQDLPNFEVPVEQDFWTLQEKNLNKVTLEHLNGEQSLNLTHGEYNALLSSIKVIPLTAFCLNKVRHTYKNKELRYYLIGSGLTLKKLVISFVVSHNGEHSFISEITVNSWKVPGDTLYEQYIQKVVNKLSKADKSGILDKVITGKLKPVFD